MSCQFYIGTSGWQYGDWSDGNFYPEGLKEKDWLEYYSQHFQTVEVNSTFYHQMPASAYLRWREITPRSFIFSVKLSRFLTHVKKLNDVIGPWHNFINNAKNLKTKLGPILVQLPPRFKANPVKLEKLFKVAGEKYKLALEVRDSSWFNDTIYKLLNKYNVSLVFSDLPQWLPPEIITADFIYVRRHGPAETYCSNYSRSKLLAMADKIKKWRKQVKEIFVYFNNDSRGLAVKNAQTLINLTSNFNKYGHK